MTPTVAARIIREVEDLPGDWLVRAREEAARRDGKGKPYSQGALAISVGRDRATVQRWEASTIDYLSWVGILSILGLPPDWQPGENDDEAGEP